MAVKTEARGALSKEEFAAAKAKQESDIAEIMAAFDNEAAAKEARFNAALAKRQEEESWNKRGEEKSRENPGVKYVDSTAARERVIEEFQAEYEAKNGYVEKVVQYVATEDGSFVPSIPDITSSTNLDEDWNFVTLEYMQDSLSGDEARLPYDRTPYFQLDVEQLGGGRLAVKLTDRNEHQQARLRLSGQLLPDGLEEDRMLYIADESTFIHPSVVLQTDKSLEQLVTVIHAGNVTHTSF